MSNAPSASSSDSESSSTSIQKYPIKPTQKVDAVDSEDSDADASSSDDDDDDDNADANVNDDGETDDEPVLSHAALRKQKRKELKAAAKVSEPSSASATKKQKIKNAAELPPSKLPKRQNSVWVGNLSFKTTPESLRQFFDGVGEITRIHMPMKVASGGPAGAGIRKENRGFAYVDFASPDAKTVAITLSENHLDGRRLLIKDGDSFEGRPAPAMPADGGDPSSSKGPHTGHSKRAQQILAAQKQPPGQTLFMGNLAFSTTSESIRATLESHYAKKPPTHGDGAEASEPWIRQVRLGTFEDSGKCKGWAFVDFVSTEAATAALTNVRNHHLDGRALVLEYASPDAVRRGGGPRNNGQRKEHPRDGERSPKRKARTDLADDAQEGEEQAPPKRRRVEKESRPTSAKEGRGGKQPRARAKPGAALALAKRETVAIVPSQGRKIVFD